MKKENNMSDLSIQLFEQLSESITNTIVSLRLEQIENLESIKFETGKLTELRGQLKKLQAEIDSVSKTIATLKYNRRLIGGDIRTAKRNSYKLNKSYTSGIEQINLKEYELKSKRR